jgi:CRISPR-associated protein Cas2
MIEVKAGVFLGRMTARVRDELWEAAVKGSKAGSCLQLWDTPSEQGYALRSHGEPSYAPVEFDGLTLIRHAARGRKDATNPPF